MFDEKNKKCYHVLIIKFDNEIKYKRGMRL